MRGRTGSRRRPRHSAASAQTPPASRTRPRPGARASAAGTARRSGCRRLRASARASFQPQLCLAVPQEAQGERGLSSTSHTAVHLSHATSHFLQAKSRQCTRRMGTPCSASVTCETCPVQAKSRQCARRVRPTGGAQVEHGVDDLVVGLAQAQHEAALGVHALGLGRAQHVQALHVARARVAHAPLRARGRRVRRAAAAASRRPGAKARPLHTRWRPRVQSARRPRRRRSRCAQASAASPAVAPRARVGIGYMVGCRLGIG